MNLDLEGMYSQSKEKKSRGEVLELFQFCAGSLEFLVKEITDNFIRKKDLVSRNKKLYTFRSKIDYLKRKKVIDESLHHNLIILSGIRNNFHDFLNMDRTIFNKLNDIRLDNDFIKKLENGTRKYELIVSVCSCQLFKIGDDLSPENTLHLESTNETKFEPLKDPFS